MDISFLHLLHENSYKCFVFVSIQIYANEELTRRCSSKLHEIDFKLKYLFEFSIVIDLYLFMTEFIFEIEQIFSSPFCRIRCDFAMLDAIFFLKCCFALREENKFSCTFNKLLRNLSTFRAMPMTLQD